MVKKNYNETIDEYIKYAKAQGCSDEVTEKIPAMMEAMMYQALFENYKGPTPEEINPGFFESFSDKETA